MYEQLISLAAAIKDGGTGIQSIFASDFKTPSDWQRFIRNHFKLPPKIKNLCPLWQSPTPMNNQLAFQALFIASWVVFPFEKGSFMLRLDQDVFELAKASLAHLDKRISSHLSKKGWSAALGFNFLIGYQELLIQVEDDLLFLKPEGHPLKGFKNTLIHFYSWGVKSVTGAGITANPSLQILAKNGGIITPRAAENYSKAYQSLLAYMKLTGTLITIRAVAEALLGTSYQKALKYQNKRPTIRANWLKRFLKINPYFHTLRNYPNHSTLGTHLTNATLINTLQNIIGFAKDELPQISQFKQLVLAAEEDIKQICKSLKKDTEYTGGLRYFEEVRLSQQDIDEGLAVFEKLLK